MTSKTIRRRVILAAALAFALGCGAVNTPSSMDAGTETNATADATGVSDTSIDSTDVGADDPTDDAGGMGGTDGGDSTDVFEDATRNPADAGQADAGIDDAGSNAIDAATDSDDSPADSGDLADAGSPVDAGGGGDGRIDATAGGDSSRDTASDGGATPDASGDSGAVVSCHPDTRFGDPIPVYGLNRDPGTEFRLNLSPDELTVYVAKGGGWWIADIHSAKRATRMDPFGKLVPLMSVNTDAAEDSVGVTGDGLTLFVESSRSGRGRIYRATRRTIAEQFGLPIQVILDPDPLDEMDPYVLPDGTALYFTASLPADSGFYRAALNGATAEMPTMVLPEGPRFPVVSADELTIYFADGAPLRTWMATRTSRDLPFSDRIDLVELNTPDADTYPQWISPDGCRLYLTRSFGGPAYSFVGERLHR